MVARLGSSSKSSGFEGACDGESAGPGLQIEEVVGGGLRGAESRPSSAIALELTPGARYLVMAYCLGSAPTAAERTGDRKNPRQPFKVRFYASQPLQVNVEEFSAPSPKHQKLALAALHETLLRFAPTVDEVSYGVASASCGGGAPAAAAQQSMWRRRRQSGEMSMFGQLKRKMLLLGNGDGTGCSLLVVHGEGATACVVVNAGQQPCTVEVRAHCKSNLARGQVGLQAFSFLL